MENKDRELNISTRLVILLNGTDTSDGTRGLGASSRVRMHTGRRRLRIDQLGRWTQMSRCTISGLRELLLLLFSTGPGDSGGVRSNCSECLNFKG